jgi:hypothetical protein
MFKILNGQWSHTSQTPIVSKENISEEKVSEDSSETFECFRKWSVDLPITAEKQ